MTPEFETLARNVQGLNVREALQTSRLSPEMLKACTSEERSHAVRVADDRWSATAARTGTRRHSSGRASVTVRSRSPPAPDPGPQTLDPTARDPDTGAQSPELRTMDPRAQTPGQRPRSLDAVADPGPQSGQTPSAKQTSRRCILI